MSFRGPFYQYWLTLILTWINNHMPSKAWMKLLIHFKTSTVLWDWLSSFISPFVIDFITHPRRDLSQTMLVKGAPSVLLLPVLMPFMVFNPVSAACTPWSCDRGSQCSTTLAHFRHAVRWISRDTWLLWGPVNRWPGSLGDCGQGFGDKYGTVQASCYCMCYCCNLTLLEALSPMKV